ncbi:D-alanyl-lipoteichoic acid biosynthesis protein DltD, partial [Streptococcus sp. DD13]|uniref:D-alanyl-lipoteichoic acid biosynthesis protein DltD n=1 Tax=Streptococcus sp. DD13 TaxID=1777881 RepID=UPI002F91BA4C
MLAEKKDAVAFSSESFKNATKKVQALSDPSENFVPFFGSSEWLRLDSFHPAVLAEKYNRPYTPYFLGQRGAVSMVHYLGIQQMRPQLEGKKAVFVVSPQWFIRIGIRKEFLEKYLTTDEITSFLLKERTQVSEEEKMVAERLVKQLPNIPMASQ